jgi:hypothetical protein
MKKGLATICVMCLLLVLTVVSKSFADSEAGRVLAVKKDVYVIRDAVRDNAEPKMQLLTKDAVETDEKSRTKLFFSDDSILNIGELSRVEVEEYLFSSEANRSKSVYKLTNGYLKVVVGRSDLEIHTPTVLVAARGTKIIVSVEGSGPSEFTRVLVTESAAAVSFHGDPSGKVYTVNAGQEGKFPVAGAPSVAPISESVMGKFSSDTMVMNDEVDTDFELPAMVDAGYDVPPPPPTATTVLIDQTPEIITVPVRININFP